MKHTGRVAAALGLCAALASAPTVVALGAPAPESITTTLPAHVEMGATGTVAVTYSVTTLYPASAVEVTLVDQSRVVARQTASEQNSTHFTGTLVLMAASLAGSGSFDWEIVAGFSMHNGAIQEQVSILQHSLLGLNARRDGRDIRLRGVARRLDASGRSWVAWPAESIVVQRWTEHGWRTIRQLRSDSQGQVNTTLGIPFRVGLRLVSSSTSGIWGQTTPSAVS